MFFLSIYFTPPIAYYICNVYLCYNKTNKYMKNLDYFGNEIKLPAIGDKVLRDGYMFNVTEVHPVDDISIIASIILKGDSGSVDVGYYNFIKHEKAVC